MVKFKIQGEPKALPRSYAHAQKWLYRPFLLVSVGSNRYS